MQQPDAPSAEKTGLLPLAKLRPPLPILELLCGCTPSLVVWVHTLWVGALSSCGGNLFLRWQATSHETMYQLNDLKKSADFVGKLTFENHLIDTLCQMRLPLCAFIR